MKLFFLICLFSPFSEVYSNCIWNGIDQIQCDLRILDFRRDSAEVPPEAAEVKTLDVDCSDAFYFESQLRSDHFGDLSELKNLRINHCKIRRLPPRSFVSLSRLQFLEIHTHNQDWDQLHFEPDYESFIGLNSLQVLDLSYNNLISLPKGLLCPLKSLKKLNISFNQIPDLSDLKLGNVSPCRLSVNELIVRNSGVSSFPARTLQSLMELYTLDVSRNKLEVLSSKSLSGLKNLKMLDLSFNFLSDLSSNIFEDLKNLENLQLSGNTLTSLDLEVFESLSTLKVLNLSKNSLDENQIKPGLFSSLSALVILDLSSNHISKLQSELFLDLKELRVLNLNQNRLYTIGSRSFVFLQNLRIIYLSSNNLESLQHQTLKGLDKLNSIYLDGNKIHSLHKNSLNNCTTLKEIVLSNNLLTQVPSALYDLKSLVHLDLSLNRISVLKRESLQSLPKLSSLKMGNNELNKIGEGTFIQAPNLKSLDLSNNKFKILERETFRALKSLEALNLAENYLEDMNGIFATQVTLKWLNISFNKLGWFDYAFLPPSLEWLDINNNQIDSIGNYYALKNDYSLKYMDVSSNQIKVLKPLSVLSSLTHLYLDDNEISLIEPNAFLGRTNLTQVTLKRNKLQSLEMMSLMISPTSILSYSPEFHISDNPLVCDCHLQWFKSINSRTNQYPTIADMDMIKCSVRSNSHYALILPLPSVPNEKFLCPYSSHCFSLCMCCDFFACDCQMQCPDKCSCFRDSTWSSNIIQCSDQNLTDTPSLVPVDATSLFMDGNNFTSLKPSMFLGRSRLVKLLLNGSRIADIAEGSFEGLNNLRVLDLSKNRLAKLQVSNFIGLDLLQELYLQKNQLVHIHENTFSHLMNLRTLRLDENLLISFPVWTLNTNVNLKAVSLAHNWWQCDCDFLNKFREFLEIKSENIKDLETIECTSREEPLKGSCSNSGLIAHRHRVGASNIFDGQSILIGSICSLILTGLLLLLGVILYATREDLKIKLHSKYGVRFCTKSSRHINETKDKVFFDALIMYSPTDSEIAVDKLGKTLESTYKLIYNQRDLSGNYYSQGFKSTLKASANHVVLLSPSFFQNEWRQFRSGIALLVHYIVILIDDIPNDMDKSDEVQDFLKQAKKILKFSESGFWRKLKYYMTDPILPTTREGGAEIDAWTFSKPDIYQESTPMLASLLGGGSNPSSPPLKKPHNCSSHISTMRPSLTTSGLMATPAQQNFIHSRSVSAVVTGRRETIYGEHQRSSSSTEPTQKFEHLYERPRRPALRPSHPRSASGVTPIRRTEYRTRAYNSTVDLYGETPKSYENQNPHNHYRSTSTPFDKRGFVL